MQMQTIEEIVGLSQVDRVTLLTTTVKSHSSTQKSAAKIMAAMIKAGDATDDNISAFALKHCGIEIRSAVQGVYQSLKVLRAIMDGKIANATEADFDRIGWTAMQELSRFMNPKSLLHNHIEEANQKFLGDNPVSELKKLAKKINDEKPTVGETTETPSVETTPTEFPSAENTRPADLFAHIAAIKAEIESEHDTAKLAEIQGLMYNLIVQAQEKIDNATPSTAAIAA